MKTQTDSIKTAALLFGCVLVAIATMLLLSPRNQPQRTANDQKATQENVPTRSGPRSIPMDLAGANAIAVDLQGMIYVSGSQKIIKINTSGKQLLDISLSQPAGAIAIGSKGNIFAGIQNRVTVFDPQGKVAAEWMALGENGQITSLSVSSTRVAVADAGQHCIWIFDLEGRLKKRITGTGEKGFVLPSLYFDTAIEESGRILAANPGRQRIERYSAEGTFITAWGKASVEPEGFCGCCNPAHFALLPDGRVVTSEKGLRRVKTFSAEGRFQRVLLDEKILGRGPETLDIAVDSQGEIYILDTVKKQILVLQRQ